MNRIKSLVYLKSSAFYIIIFFIAAFFEPLINFVVLTEVLLIYNAFRKRAHLMFSNKERILILFLLMTSFVSFINHSGVSFFTYWHHCVITPLILYINGKLIRNEGDLINIAYPIAFISAVCISISIFLTPLNIEIKDNQWTDEHTRIFRHFFAYDAIYNGTGVIIFLIPSFLLLFLKSTKTIFFYFKLIVIILIVYCIYKSESRSALYFIVCLGLYYFNQFNSVKKLNFTITATLLISVALIITDELNLNILPERFTLNYTKEAGLTSRDLIWASAISMIALNPLGNPSPSLEIMGQTFSTHNNFLTYWLLFGWFTGLIATYILFSLEITILKSSFQSKGSNKYLPYILTAIFINFFVESPAISNAFSYAFYSMLIGFAMKNTTQHTKIFRTQNILTDQELTKQYI